MTYPRKSLRIASITLALATASVCGYALPAAAQINLSIGVPAPPGVVFSFDVGSVAYAYDDGYWDYDHHWHVWRDMHERDMFRERYHDRYEARMHERAENGGWREVREDERARRREEDRRYAEHREEHHEEERR